MTEWRRVYLDSLVEKITYGFTNPMPTTDVGPFMITAKDIREGRIDYLTARHTSIDAYKNDLTDKSRPRIGDVLLTKDGSIGRVAVCDYEPICINQSVALLRPNDEVLPRFLAYLLQAPEYQNQMEHDSAGSTIKHIYISRVGKMRVSVPGKGEQAAVVEVLGALDDKIAANARELSTLDDLASTMVRDALTDDGREESLADTARVEMGSSPKGEDLNSSGDGTVFYQGIRDFGLRFPTRRIWASETTRLARPGDTLLSVRAPVGTVNIAEETSCIGRGLAAVTSTQSRPYTLFHLLKLAKAKWEPFNSSGTVYGSINRRQLETITLPVVCVGQEVQLEAELTALEDRLRNVIRESRALGETRDALLPQLMSGKLRVRDAEQVVSDAV